MDGKAKPYEWVVLASGLLMIVTSFLSWFSSSVTGSDETTALSSAWGEPFFPLATIVPLLGLISALLVVVNRFTRVEVPDPLLRLPLPRLYLCLGVLALLTAGLLLPTVTYDNSGGFSVSASLGYWLNQLGAMGLVVGGVLALQERTAAVGDGAVGDGALGDAAVGDGSGAPGGPPRPHELVIMVGGGVAFVFSFFTWFVDELDGVEVSSSSAWGDGLFPLAALVPLFGLAMAVGVAVTRFTPVRLPDSVVGIGRTPVHLLMSAYAVLLTVAFFVYERSLGFDNGFVVVTVSAAFGYYLCLLGSVALLVGSVMAYRDGGGAAPLAGAAGGDTPPQPL